MRTLLVVVFALGCGGSAAKERKSCERAIALCHYSEGLDTCVTDVKELKPAMGDSYDKFLDCTSEATSCGEYIGCTVGGIGSEGMKQIDGLRRGMEKMMGDKLRALTKPGD